MLCLELKNVTKSYKDIVAIKSCSLIMTEGVYGLLGPNGAGKSTLMKCLADIIKPTEGEILLDKEDIYLLGTQYRKRLGFMPQDIGFYPAFTARQIIEYFALLKDKKIGKNEIDNILKSVNLYDARKKKVGGFSGGMKRRLAIAVTMLNDPDILIFDEPTAGLDPKERANFKNLLKEISKSKIIIIATHIISDLEDVCDKVIFIKNGELALLTEEKSELEKNYMDIFGD